MTEARPDGGMKGITLKGVIPNPPSWRGNARKGDWGIYPP